VHLRGLLRIVRGGRRPISLFFPVRRARFDQAEFDPADSDGAGGAYVVGGDFQDDQRPRVKALRRFQGVNINCQGLVPEARLIDPLARSEIFTAKI
jgi:hypothetical protein